MTDEPLEPKRVILRMLHGRVPSEVRVAVEDLATSTTPETRYLLTDLFYVMDSINDSELDSRLCTRLEQCQITDDRISDVAQFVLAHNSDRALPALLSLIEPAAAAIVESVAAIASVMLLHTQTSEGWDKVFELLHRKPNLAARILGAFAEGCLRSRRQDETLEFAKLSFEQVGRLIALLMLTFPPETDPRHEEAYSFGPNDAARQLRDQLISFLGKQRELDALKALRMLEQQFGSKYPWLRRPRAQCERLYRLSRWVPIAPSSVAALFWANEKRLIRSGRDALEGLVTGIEQYAARLRRSSPSDLEDLWNLPRKGRATPKEEERVTDKLCLAIRDYYHACAVTADREVQVFRRKLSSAAGGAPGSEVDLLCSVPAAGITSGDAIKVPIEVKLAHNREARTGLKDQLLDRYMKELGTDLGVFVVVWMGKMKPGSVYKPLWATPVAAQKELEQMAADLVSLSQGELDLRVVVIDASLPLVSVVRGAGRKHVKKAGSRKRGSVRSGRGRMRVSVTANKTMKKGAKKLPRPVPDARKKKTSGLKHALDR
jgi:hypothetical protein